VLREGDALIVTRLDRLARSTRGLLNILDGITKAAQAFTCLARQSCGSLLLDDIDGESQRVFRLVLLADSRTSQQLAMLPVRLCESLYCTVVRRKVDRNTRPAAIDCGLEGAYAIAPCGLRPHC
jgi:hypothetical protein